MHDLIIVGGGPAGVAAGIYAARKKIKTLLVTDHFGGQSLISADVQNWIGIKSISGYDLGKMMEEHLKAQEGIEIAEGDLVTKISPTLPAEASVKAGSPIGPISPISPIGFRVETKNGKALETKTILMAAGSRRRKLSVPGEDKFTGKGVVYCSTCDAPLFQDKVTAVIGGGNAGFEAVIDLLPYAKKIYLLERSERLKGDPLTQEKIKSNPKVEVILNAKTTEIFGAPPAGGFVTGLKYMDLRSRYIELKVDGVFVEIGELPNSDVVKDLVQLNKAGEIIVDHKTQKTSQEGIWAAGDVCDVLYKQNNISMGDAVKAVLNIYEYLNKSLPAQAGN